MGALPRNSPVQQKHVCWGLNSAKPVGAAGDMDNSLPRGQPAQARAHLTIRFGLVTDQYYKVATVGPLSKALNSLCSWGTE